MTKKGWIIFIGLIIAGLATAIYLSKQDEVTVDNIDVNAVQAASDSNGNIADHTFGKLDSKVSLIEYGDFQCPGCGTVALILENLTKKYEDKLLFVFRSRLISGHQNARAAASFAEAAGLQGKYWETHRAIFADQSGWNTLSGQDRTDYFTNLLTTAGADSNKALENIDSDQIKKKIAFDEALSEKHGVTGTPSLFLNGKNVSNYDVKDGALIPSDDDSSTPTVWSDETYFDTLILQPALKEAGLL